MSIRSSYGIAYDVQAASWFNNAMTLPWTPSIVGVFGTLDDPWRDFPGGNPFPLPRLTPMRRFQHTRLITPLAKMSSRP